MRLGSTHILSYLAFSLTLDTLQANTCSNWDKVWNTCSTLPCRKLGSRLWNTPSCRESCPQSLGPSAFSHSATPLITHGLFLLFLSTEINISVEEYNSSRVGVVSQILNIGLFPNALSESRNFVYCFLTTWQARFPSKIKIGPPQPPYHPKTGAKS